MIGAALPQTSPDPTASLGCREQNRMQCCPCGCTNALGNNKMMYNNALSLRTPLYDAQHGWLLSALSDLSNFGDLPALTPETLPEL